VWFGSGIGIGEFEGGEVFGVVLDGAVEAFDVAVFGSGCGVGAALEAGAGGGVVFSSSFEVIGPLDADAVEIVVLVVVLFGPKSTELKLGLAIYALQSPMSATDRSLSYTAPLHACFHPFMSSDLH
jgi:hypothetical protein